MWNINVSNLSFTKRLHSVLFEKVNPLQEKRIVNMGCSYAAVLFVETLYILFFTDFGSKSIVSMLVLWVIGMTVLMSTLFRKEYMRDLNTGILKFIFYSIYLIFFMLNIFIFIDHQDYAIFIVVYVGFCETILGIASLLILLDSKYNELYKL